MTCSSAARGSATRSSAGPRGPPPAARSPRSAGRRAARHLQRADADRLVPRRSRDAPVGSGAARDRRRAATPSSSTATPKADDLTGTTRRLSTTELDDGARTVTIVATDAAGQETTSVPATLKVDRRAPRLRLRLRGARSACA